MDEITRLTGARNFHTPNEKYGYIESIDSIMELDGEVAKVIAEWHEHSLKSNSDIIMHQMMFLASDNIDHPHAMLLKMKSMVSSEN